MSIKLELKGNKKKSDNQSFDFEIKEGSFSNVICDSKKELNRFVSTLKGKDLSFENDLLLINSEEALNKSWIKERVSFLNNKSLFYRIFNAKYSTFISLIFNNEFFKYVRSKYIISKYEYLNFKKSKKCSTVIALRNEISYIIENFVNSSIDIEKNWLNEYLSHITIFNNEKIEENNFPNDIKNILKDYIQNQEKLKNYYIQERFLQSLWDKIYLLIDLSSSCQCEYNVKKSKSRKLKKKVKLFRYKEQVDVVRKHLSLLDLNVTILKRKIRKLKVRISNLKLMMSRALNKSDSNLKFKDIIKAINKWLILTNDQRDEFTKKQDQLIFETLQNEGDILKGKVIEYIHTYHQKILNDELEYENEIEFKSELKKLKKEKKSILKNCWDWIDRECEKYEIKINFLSIDIRGINSIYMRIVKEIFSNKKNIVLENVISSLTYKDRIEFIKTLKKILDKNKAISFIFVDNKYDAVVDYNKEIFIYKEKILKQINPQIIFENNRDEINKILKNCNIFPVQKSDGYLFINGKKIKCSTDNIDEADKNIFLNPFKLTESKNSIYKFTIKIIDKIIAPEKNFKFGVTENKTKVMFYSDKEYKVNEKVTLFVSEDSIMKGQ